MKLKDLINGGALEVKYLSGLEEFQQKYDKISVLSYSENDIINLGDEVMMKNVYGDYEKAVVIEISASYGHQTLYRIKTHNNAYIVMKSEIFKKNDKTDILSYKVRCIKAKTDTYFLENNIYNIKNGRLFDKMDEGWTDWAKEGHNFENLKKWWSYYGYEFELVEVKHPHELIPFFTNDCEKNKSVRFDFKEKKMRDWEKLLKSLNVKNVWINEDKKSVTVEMDDFVGTKATARACKEDIFDVKVGLFIAVGKAKSGMSNTKLKEVVNQMRKDKQAEIDKDILKKAEFKIKKKYEKKIQEELRNLRGK